MAWVWVLAWFAGLASVVQSGISKRLAERAGLANVLHASNLVVLLGGAVILTAIAASANGDFARLLKPKSGSFEWSWWLLVPGAMGLFIITVSPFAIGKIGALQVFVFIVFGQVIGSALWDRFVEDQPFDRYRVIGALLTLAGAGAISLSKPVS